MSKKVARSLLAALCLAALLLADAAPLSIVQDVRAVTQAQIDAKKQEKKHLQQVVNQKPQNKKDLLYFHKKIHLKDQHIPKQAKKYYKIY